MRTAVIMLIVSAFCVHGSNYEKLVAMVRKEYSHKQTEYNEMARAKRYHYEIQTVEDFPLWCSNDVSKEPNGRAVWVDEYGMVLYETDNGVYISVRSWIDRDRDTPAQVSRVFLYRQNSKGVWYRVDTIKITQTWDEECGWVCQR
jgi:hypothetical protein